MTTELITREDRAQLAAFFPTDEDRLITACVQGYTGWAARTDKSAALVTGDFAFFAGEADGKLLAWAAAHKREYMIVCGDEAWLRLAEGFPCKCSRSRRYYLKTPAQFDTEMLTRLAKTHPLEMIDEGLFDRLLQVDQLRDLCGCSRDKAAFFRFGAGFAALRDDAVMGGAAAYAWDDTGIEFEVDTLPEYRNRGVAAACAAALILECLRRGKEPHWDAANETSLRLAARLGFIPGGTYEIVTWE